MGLESITLYALTKNWYIYDKIFNVNYIVQFWSEVHTKLQHAKTAWSSQVGQYYVTIQLVLLVALLICWFVDILWF